MSRILCLSLLAACNLSETPQSLEPSPPPSAGSLDLVVPAFQPGVTSEITVAGAPPNSLVYLGASPGAPQPGPCLAVAGGLCLELANPTLLGTTTADAQGDAQFFVTAPATLPIGFDVTLQAVAIAGTFGSGSASSPPVQSRVIRDADFDGYDSSVDCDDNDSRVYPGAAEICDGVDNDCNPLSLEEGAITVNGTAFNDLTNAIDTAPSGAVIELCGGDFTLDRIWIRRDVTIEGIGPDRSILRGSGNQLIDAEANVTLRHLEVRDGDTTAAIEFGCYLDCWDYVVEDVLFADNAAGALRASTQSLVIRDSIFQENVGEGALRVNYGDTLLQRVQFLDNRATFIGGAIHIADDTEVTLEDSTVWRNHGQAAVRVEGRLVSDNTDWGFGPTTDNTNDDVSVRLYTQGYDLDYAAYGAGASFACYSRGGYGHYGCQ
jgi:hypothetical protein